MNNNCKHYKSLGKDNICPEADSRNCLENIEPDLSNLFGKLNIPAMERDILLSQRSVCWKKLKDILVFLFNRQSNN